MTESRFIQGVAKAVLTIHVLNCGHLSSFTAKFKSIVWGYFQTQYYTTGSFFKAEFELGLHYFPWSL